MKMRELIFFGLFLKLNCRKNLISIQNNLEDVK
jgi:hypothetical protein